MEPASLVKQKAGDHYVIMSDGFQDPSKYNYYTNSAKAFSYDSRSIIAARSMICGPLKGQFSAPACLLFTGWPNDSGDCRYYKKLKTGYKWYAEWVDDVRTYQQVNIDVGTYKVKLSPGQTATLVLKIKNPYPYPINFSNTVNKHEVVVGSLLF